ncbi:MAG: polyprenyl synthetase family protein [Planctomycetota bacterium]|nr:MAG: polyprenyl synthetase family protein [Planctomycetota bacterium]
MSSATHDLRSLDQTRIRLAALYLPIAQDLEASELIYREELKSRIDFVQILVDHAARFQGKRLRPTLLLLSAQACGGIRPIHHQLVAVVEMIHTASLVHDDILDDAMIRRHASTINVEWGNESAVLLGDYLFTHAFHLAAATGSTVACQWIARATNRVWEGEMTQNHHCGNMDLDEATYFDIIRGKTAELTAVSAALGAYFTDSETLVVEALEAYGTNLGIAFQIVDDLLDILGDERNTGKSLGTDMNKIKLTLPMIRFLASAPAEDADHLRRLILDQSSLPNRRKSVRDLIGTTNTFEECWQCAFDYANQARENLSILEDSQAKAILVAVAEGAVRRAF